MKVVMVEPGQYARITEIEDTLEAKQAAVGGLITCAYPWEELVCIVANDEGLINGMPLNRYVEDYQVLAGPFFICGLTEDDFCSLTDEQAERYCQMFLRPELFLNHGEKWMRIPYDDPNLPGAPEEVAERINQRKGFPDLCFAATPDTGDLFMLRYGKTTYCPLVPQSSHKSGQECADALNEQVGVSKAQQAAMLYGWASGWELRIPPSRFEENGQIKTTPNKTKEREER